MDIDTEKFQYEILHNTSYRGIPTYKNPLDAWVYQEIIYETKPDVIIEIGNKFGGSALYLLDCMLHVVADPSVYAIDIDHSKLKVLNPGIHFIEGDATNKAVWNEILLAIPLTARVMVVEDSSHTYDNTLNILKAYSSFVSLGCYFIVEDTIINHGLRRTGYNKDGNAYDAVMDFFKHHPEFEIDKSREKYGLTHNPNGYLKRV